VSAQAPNHPGTDTLRPSDLASFERFGIPAELLTAAGVHRVTDQQARDEYGIRYKSAHLEGIVFPYLDPASEQVAAYRLRRDNPELESDGRPIAKYVSSSDRRRFYFPPRSGALLRDAAIPIVFVEAEKSVLAIAAAANRDDRQLLPLGTGGCWGWRGVTGKHTDASGTRVDQKGPLPDFDRIDWKGRDVIIGFDSNTKTNPKVQAARRALAKELGGRGARVRIMDLPAEEGVNGPDDYIAKHGDKQLLGLVDRARSRAAKAADRESQLDALVHLALREKPELFRDDQMPYIAIRAEGHVDTYQVHSKQTRAWLRRLYFDATGRAAGSQALQDALNQVEANALGGACRRVFVRIARTDDAIYVDLGDASGRVVQIIPGGWDVLRSSPVPFRRPGGLLPLPEPVRGRSIADLRQFVNVATDDDFVLLVSFLLAALRGRFPYPLLVINGEEGSCKSTLARVICSLIDPNRACLRSEPRDVRDLMIQADTTHLLSFDNISQLRSSDDLARLATGGGFATRTLHTNRDEEIFEGGRPILLNGIPEFVKQSDLVSRAIFLTLPTIEASRRFDDDTFWIEFERARPAILGALFDAVAEGLRRWESVHLTEASRMATFERWITAAESACPWRAGSFALAYRTNRSRAVESVLEADILTDSIKMIGSYESTASQLLEKLNRLAPLDHPRSRFWPQTPKQLADRLRRLLPSLRASGIHVEFMRTGPARLISIQPVRVSPSLASSASFDVAQQTFADDALDDEAVHGASSPRPLESWTDDADDANDEPTSRGSGNGFEGD
jgi:hypothetical protein